MKIAAVYGLAFHRWVCAPVVNALRDAGHEVAEFEHMPRHAHDWLCRQDRAAPVPTALDGGRPWDAVISCDYPYAPLRTWADAPVVGLRHSLAARGNTWEPEQGEADWLVTWSEWDEWEFTRWRVEPRRAFLRAGCVWRTPLEEGDQAAARERLGRVLGVQLSGRVVSWLPTWNRDLGCDEKVIPELVQLASEGWTPILRAHGATVQRDAGRLEAAANAGILLDRTAAPWDSILAADVVVSDVSGSMFLAAMAGRPVVLVTPDRARVEALAQVDPTGPEWAFRSRVGPECHEGVGLAAAVARADSWRSSRNEALLTMIGPRAGVSPSVRLVKMLEAECRKK